jgi:hypothetical protein
MSAVTESSRSGASLAFLMVKYPEATLAPLGVARDQGRSIVIAQVVKSLASTARFGETIDAAAARVAVARRNRHKNFRQFVLT